MSDVYILPRVELRDPGWKSPKCCFTFSEIMSIVCLQCPPDTPKSRRAAENDLLENTFHQVNQSPHPHTDKCTRRRTLQHSYRKTQCKTYSV